MGTTFLHTEGRTDERRADMTKLIGRFWHFCKGANNGAYYFPFNPYSANVENMVSS